MYALVFSVHGGWGDPSSAAKGLRKNNESQVKNPKGHKKAGIGVNNTGHTFDHMFMSAGMFNYHCAVRGQAMHGTVVVT
jgi:plastocyanin